MKLNAFTVVSFLLLFVVFFSCQTYEKQNSSSSFPLTDPHHHVVNVDGPGLVAELEKEFEISEISFDTSLVKENMTTNSDESFQAFTTSGEVCRIFIEDIKTGKIYEILGLGLPWRLFSDLVWLTDDILIFDQWAQPHYGIHYAIDVYNQKLLLASPFTDVLE